MRKGFKVGIYTTASSQHLRGLSRLCKTISCRMPILSPRGGLIIVKYEGCQIPSYEIFPRQQVYAARMRQALAQCGRPMVYSLSIGGAFENWMPQYINIWRGTGDLNGQWASVLDHIDFVARTPSFAGPGGWNDPDVMGIGSGNFSEDEYTSIFTMWCMRFAFAAPRAARGNVAYEHPVQPGIDRVVDQDAGCIQGVCVASNNDLQVPGANRWAVRIPASSPWRCSTATGPRPISPRTGADPLN